MNIFIDLKIFIFILFTYSYSCYSHIHIHIYSHIHIHIYSQFDVDRSNPSTLVTESTAHCLISWHVGWYGAVASQWRIRPDFWDTPGSMYDQVVPGQVPHRSDHWGSNIGQRSIDARLARAHWPHDDSSWTHTIVTTLGHSPSADCQSILGLQYMNFYRRYMRSFSRVLNVDSLISCMLESFQFIAKKRWIQQTLLTHTYYILWVQSFLHLQ